jgi:hypothetical protein
MIKSIIRLLKLNSKKKYIKTSPIYQDKSNVKHLYSPVEVNYIIYNNITYRREIDFKNNIKWEILTSYGSKKIYCDIQIKILEEKFSNI